MGVREIPRFKLCTDLWAFEPESEGLLEAVQCFLPLGICLTLGRDDWSFLAAAE